MQRSATLSSSASSKRAKTTESTKRKRAYNPKQALVKLGRQPLPNRLSNKLTYCERVTVNLTAGGFGSFLFSVNGLYDPNLTGVGHQPLYFDQLMALYSHYAVSKSRIRVNVFSQVIYGMDMTIFIDDDSTISISNGSHARERKDASTVMVNSNLQTSPYLYKSWDCQKAFGTSPTAGDHLQGNASNNPSEQQYYVIVLDAGINGANAGIEMDVRIDFDVEFNELASIAQS